MDAGAIYRRLPGLTEGEAVALARQSWIKHPMSYDGPRAPIVVIGPRRATAAARAAAANLFGSAVLDQYGIAASAEFTDRHTLDLSY